MRFQQVAVSVFLAGMALAARASGASLDSLLTNSPFGQPPQAAAPGQAAGGALEFRSVFVDRGETFVSVFEPATRRSWWVGLNETGNPFTVRSYDADKGTAVVDYQGREHTLSLKQAKVSTMAAPAQVVNQNGAPVAQPAQTAVTTVAPNDEAARLAVIAEEIRRRRALRQQSTPQLPTQNK